VLDAGVPLFGICFGNQILGRALGLGTFKLRYGHRGVNSPCRTCAPAGCTSRATTTASRSTPERRLAVRHAVRPREVSHVDLNDDVVEGLSCSRPRPSRCSTTRRPPRAARRHGLFDSFVALMEA
jgi:carbamoyl-phosphate synthase small subunit